MEAVSHFVSSRKQRPIPVKSDPRMVVRCEGCDKEIHIDYARMLGTELNPHFVCYHKQACLIEFCERLILITES